MQNLGNWYDSITILVQLLEAFVIMYIVVALFNLFNLKINLVLALAAVLLSSNALEIYYHIVLRAYQKRRSLRVIKLKKQAT
jgi:hypothetical protein